jgi:hypothetical protein
VVLSHDTSSCSCIFVALPPPSDAVPACWCVDARDARGCVSTLRLGCQASSCCWSACVSLAAFTRCLPLLCCGVLSACLHVHGVAVCRVVTCASVAVSLRCRVG